MDGNKEGRTEPPSDLILDTPAIQVNCNNKKPQLQHKLLSTSKMSINKYMYTQLNNHKEAVSSCTDVVV